VKRAAFHIDLESESDFINMKLGIDMYERISITDKIRNNQNRLPQIQRRKNYPKTKNSPVDQILFLQRTAGNQAVQRLIKSGALQAKLRIGQPGDIYEQEADRVAEQVMRMPEPPAVSNGTPYIQRVCPGCEDEELKRQPKATSGGILDVNPDIESHIQNMRGGGQPLPKSTRAFFEPRFDYDFSQVRVHTDAKAVQSARAMNAKAYTVGKDMIFDAGNYSLNTYEGQKLLAHELTHVVQQKSGEQANSPNSIVSDNYLQRTIGDGHDLTSPRFAGDSILEACYDDEARLTKGAQGESVRKVQQALIDLGYNLGPTGADGIYGDFTWNAVKQFKANEKLGWEHMGDVGPGTMQKLDELFPGGEPPGPDMIDLTCSYFKEVLELGEVASGKRVLQKGDSGEGVRQVQQVLLLSGYSLPHYGADARFGDETEAAVLAFQSSQGLNPSGVMDSESLEPLDKDCQTLGRRLPQPNKAPSCDEICGEPDKCIVGLQEQCTDDVKKMVFDAWKEVSDNLTKAIDHMINTPDSEALRKSLNDNFKWSKGKNPPDLPVQVRSNLDQALDKMSENLCIRCRRCPPRALAHIERARGKNCLEFNCFVICPTYKDATEPLRVHTLLHELMHRVVRGAVLDLYRGQTGYPGPTSFALKMPDPYASLVDDLNP